MRQLFIPELGTPLVLAEPWTFSVFDESRNYSLIEAVPHLFETQRKRWQSSLDRWDRWKVVSLGTHTFPTGTKLIVDRIYIRQGQKGFNSVTFRASGYSNAPKEKSLRFWVKLEDANLIKFV